MHRGFMLPAFLLSLAFAAAAQPKDQILPAGTILSCSLDEQRLSSKTLQVGDPILCSLGSVALFGRPVFARGAYLSGRLAEFDDPGRFFGKGWIKIEFDRLVLPDTVVPVATRVNSAPGLPVDKEGRIRGRGHPWRDTLGWMVPVLWPIKVITLPMRGPRPTLRTEARITLRLLEDAYVPVFSAWNSNAMFPRQESARPVSATGGPSRRIIYLGASMPAAEQTRATVPQRLYAEQAQIREALPRQQAPPLTWLVFKDSVAYAVMDYWTDGSLLHWVARKDTTNMRALTSLDFETTVRLNRERGVEFTLRNTPPSPIR